ncbi:MAG: GAF domain-containing protein, partial [Anaerolineae bacterium]|nr:GAF domain-containing protein [Anaerolineae bacterium]
MLRRQTIQTYLIGFVVLALALLAIVLMIARVIQEQNTLVQAERDRSLVLTNAVNATIQDINPPVVTLDDISELDSRLLTLVNQNDGIDFIAVNWPNGEVVFHSDPAYKGQVIDDLAGIPAGKTIERSVTEFGSVYLTTTEFDTPVDEGPDTFFVTVGSAADPIKDSLFKGIVSSVLIALGTLFLVGLVTLPLVRMVISGPLRQITEGTQAFRSGELSHRITSRGNYQFRQLANTLNEMATDLQRSREVIEETNRELEQRVADRTQDLFHTLEVGRLATQMQRIDDLLPHMTNTISAQFDLYYVQVYLLDDVGRYAWLKAGSGEVGRQLVEYGHRLDLRHTSIVSQAVQRQTPVVVSDTETDKFYMPNPLLPETRSEVAVPLISGNEIVGVLDMQARTVNRFNEDNVRVFQSMANQLAAAVASAEAYQQAQVAVDRADTINRRLIFDDWSSYLGRVAQGERVGFHYDLQEVRPLDEVAPDIELQGGNGFSLRHDVTLRGQPIGTITLSEEVKRNWTVDELSLVDSVAERIAQALEQFRAVDETQNALAETATRYELGRRINQATSPGELMQAVFTTADLSMFDRANMFTFEHEDDRIISWEVVGDWHSGEGEPPIPVGTRLAPDNPSVEHLASFTDRIAFISDIETDQSLTSFTREAFKARNIRTAVLLPLRVGERLIGLLSMDGPQPYPFTERDAHANLALAGQIAASLDSLILLEQTQQRAAEMQTVAEVGTEAAQSLELETLLQNVVNLTKDR